jgi:hypothetical protein
VMVRTCTRATISRLLGEVRIRHDQRQTNETPRPGPSPACRPTRRTLAAAALGATAAEAASGAADTASFFGRASYELWGATANGLTFVSRALAAEGFGFGLYGSLCNA